MYTVNGWVRLVADDARVGEVVDGLWDYCRVFEGTNIQVRWPAPNFAHFLTIAGNANHLRTHSADVHGLLQLVAERLPASWGVFYEQDDERQEPPGPEICRVTTMIRGRLEDRMDPFFSPLVPMIEDLDWAPADDDPLDYWVEYRQQIGRPAEFDSVDLGRSEVVGVEWRGSTVEMVVDWAVDAEHPQCVKGELVRGLLRWSGVTELHWIGSGGGVLGDVAMSGGVYKVVGMLTLRAERMEVRF